jgi:hypothetical protein
MTRVDQKKVAALLANTPFEFSMKTSRGLRRQVQMLAGNYEVTAGACPWFGAVKRQRSA